MGQNCSEIFQKTAQDEIHLNYKEVDLGWISGKNPNDKNCSTIEQINSVASLLLELFKESLTMPGRL